MSATSTADPGALLQRQVAEHRLELPMLPAVAAEVLALVQQETTDAARLAAVVHRDQTLASNVLRVANSALHAGQVPCASLQQAVGRLGMQAITEIALAVAVKGRVFAHPAFAEAGALLWRHSVVTGFFTKEIARLRQRDVEIAFLCGLLHDVGKPMLLATAERLLRAAAVDSDALAAALHEHHAAAGVALAQQWRLPDQIVECIHHHHAWEQAQRFPELTMTVHLADLLAHAVAGGQPGEAPAAASIRWHPVLARLDLDPGQLVQLGARGEEARLFAAGMR